MKKFLKLPIVQSEATSAGLVIPDESIIELTATTTYKELYEAVFESYNFPT